MTKKPTTVKVTIPDSMIDDVAKQTITALEHHIKELEKENQKLKVRMSHYPLDQKKKEIKELGQKVWRAKQIWEDAISKFKDEYGEEFYDSNSYA